MNNRNNRATRAIVASGSLLAIIFMGIPWVDEYLRLRRDAAEFTELELRHTENQQRIRQLRRIEDKLSRELVAMQTRSVDPSRTESIRETLIGLVRRAGGRIRRLEISEDEVRAWAAEQDDPRNHTTPLYAKESRFVLHTHIVELQADGSLQAVRQILREISSQGWLMTTKDLTTMPTNIRESPVNLELRFAIYGLSPNGREQSEEEGFAHRSVQSRFR